MRIAGQIKNFVSISPKLATAGQPSEQQLQELARQGFEVVINLGLLDTSYSLADEADLVHGLGLVYHHIPVDFQAPGHDELMRFFEIMAASKGKKVFVHCAANKRVSTFVSLLGQARLGWSLDMAETCIRRVWKPNAVWADFIQNSRRTLSEHI
ncbi:MAG: protein tyrosine phosphatase family protein [Syntrophobacteraceae bacterium]